MITMIAIIAKRKLSVRPNKKVSSAGGDLATKTLPDLFWEECARDHLDGGILMKFWWRENGNDDDDNDDFDNDDDENFGDLALRTLFQLSSEENVPDIISVEEFCWRRKKMMIFIG